MNLLHETSFMQHVSSVSDWPYALTIDYYYCGDSYILLFRPPRMFPQIKDVSTNYTVFQQMSVVITGIYVCLFLEGCFHTITQFSDKPQYSKQTFFLVYLMMLLVTQIIV
jgi:hypothetical protein